MRLPCSELRMHRNPDPVSLALELISCGTGQSSSLRSGTPSMLWVEDPHNKVMVGDGLFGKTAHLEKRA